MLDWWSDLPWWMRLSLAFLVMGLGILITIKSMHHEPGVLLVDDPSKYQLLLGFAIIGIGFGMAVIGGKSDAEKNGYKF